MPRRGMRWWSVIACYGEYLVGLRCTVSCGVHVLL